MSPLQVILPVFTHLLPMFLLAYLGLNIMLRNAKSTEHRLAGLATLSFVAILLEEYVRHQLPLSLSPLLVAYWLSGVGLIIPCFGFHLFVKLAAVDRLMPKWLYPWVFYLPLLLFIPVLANADHLMAVQEFVQGVVWKSPVYNLQFRIAMATAIGHSLLYLVPLVLGHRRTTSPELKAVFRQLMLGVVLSAVWFAVFGLFDWGSLLPPYPYIYGGVVWCWFLLRTMQRYEFLHSRDKRFQKLFDLNPAAILVVGADGRVEEANPSARRLFGSVALDRGGLLDLLGADLRALVVGGRGVRQFETQVTVDGQVRDLLVDGDALAIEHHPHTLLILRDVTELKRTQREATFLAYHDPLTRLPNRRRFTEAFDELLRQSPRGALALIDVDNFKKINDRFGHAAGDQALVHLAGQLASVVGTRGLVARLGGDEFVFCLGAEVVDEVETLLAALLTAVSGPMVHQGTRVPLSLSIGVSFFPEDGRELSPLLSRADQAMYQVKHGSKNGYRLTRGLITHP